MSQQFGIQRIGPELLDGIELIPQRMERGLLDGIEPQTLR